MDQGNGAMFRCCIVELELCYQTRIVDCGVLETTDAIQEFYMLIPSTKEITILLIPFSRTHPTHVLVSLSIKSPVTARNASSSSALRGSQCPPTQSCSCAITRTPLSIPIDSPKQSVVASRPPTPNLSSQLPAAYPLCELEH
jgi:hypothetical protein